MHVLRSEIETIITHEETDGSLPQSGTKEELVVGKSRVSTLVLYH